MSTHTFQCLKKKKSFFSKTEKLQKNTLFLECFWGRYSAKSCQKKTPPRSPKKTTATFALKIFEIKWSSMHRQYLSKKLYSVFIYW